MKKRTTKIMIFIIGLFILILGGIKMIHNHKIDKNLFKNVEHLNRYLASHNNPVLNSVKLKDKNISGLHMPKGMMDEMDWNRVNVSHSDIENTIIKNSLFTDVDFYNSTFKNVEFKNVRFISTAPQGGLLLTTAWFDNSKLKNVRFINCVFEGEVKLRNLQNSDVTIINSKLTDTDFDNSEVKLNIKNSKLIYVEITSTKPDTDFIMQDGELINTRFEYNAHLNKLELNGVKTKDVGLEEVQVNSITLKNSKLDLGISDSKTKVQNIYLNNDQIKDFGIGNGNFKEIFISNCSAINDGIGFSNAKIQKVTIKNSTSNDFYFDGTNIDNLILANFSFQGSDSTNAVINNAQFDNVHIEGNINLSKTKIKTLQTRNLTWNHNNIKVNTKGSNLEFTAHGLRIKGVWPEITKDHWQIFHWKGA